MAGIEAPEYQVNVSQENSINKFAVQGEENSRVLTLHLVETVQTVTALGETVIRQNPLDLTGCTVRLYVKKPDGNATSTDGTIVDTGASGTQNTVTFVLSQQTTAAAGNAHCTVAVFGSNGTELKATGITLNIAADDMEQTIVSTSEFVSLAEALNKAEFAEKIAEDSAAEINQTVSAASTELQSLETQSSGIATAETARVDAEGKRVTAESDRVTAEGKRQTAETARSDAEGKRTSNESTRQTAESGRATAESSRASEESKRATAETARASAEQTRVQQESGRATAETVRADAESKRATSETVRSDAEGKRATAEQGRVDAESARVTAEQARQTAESGRQTAETARELASQTAVSSADAATTRANTAAKSAEDVAGGDLLIDKPDGTAGYNRLYIDDVQTVARDTKTTIPAMRTIDTQPTFKLYGYSHQDGVPTPENPIDPVSLQSPLKVTIGTTDYSIPLTASDTEKYPDGLELRAVKDRGTAGIPDSRDYIGLGEDGRWKIYQNVNKKVVQGVEGEDSGSGHPNQQILTFDQSRIAHNTLWLNSYTDLAWPASVNTGTYWICYYNNTSYYWFDGNKYTLEQIQAMEKQHPMVILYGTCKTTVIDLSDDAQTVLNKMRSAISPLANGTTLDITSTAKMDIISRSEMTKKQEQINSNAANIAYNQLSFAAQAAQQEIEIKEIKEQTTPFTKVTGNTDMDALSTTGIYGIATSSYTNGPPGMTHHGLLIVDKNGDGTQTFLPDSTVSSVYRRVGYSDGTWGAWVQETLMSPDDVARLKSALTKSQADTYYSGKIKTITAMLSTTWTNKTQDITVAGVTPTSTIAIKPADSATADQREAWRSAMISDTCGDGKITLTADGDEPTAGIPLTVTIWGG
jgi:hypothetical protein